MAFGDRLRELRDQRGFKQEELAHRAGLDRTYVSQAEQGRRNATIVTLQKLAAALDTTVADLLADPSEKTAG